MEHIFQKINELAEKYRDYSADNLSKLVKIRSLCTHEKDVQLTLTGMMEEAGFDEVKRDGMGNVIGRIGTGRKILAIDGHVDTVDTGTRENWTFDPLGGAIKDGFIHGRGSVDQKGGIASFLTSGKILKELGFKEDLTIYFIGSVMEEDCEGLSWRYIIEEDKIKPDVVILTEPTGLAITRGQRGRMEMEVLFSGTSCHGSAPERGKNAIYMASRVALEIEKLNNTYKSKGFLGKGSITVTEIISGSPSLCAVPDYAKIHLDRRLTTGETIEVALKEIEELSRHFNAKVKLPYYSGKSYTGLDSGMEMYYPAWEMPEDHEVIQTGVNAYKNCFAEAPKVDKWVFSTNGIMTCGIYGIPTIGFGPGNEVLAHAPDEKVNIRDLVAASAFYAAYAFELIK